MSPKSNIPRALGLLLGLCLGLLQSEAMAESATPRTVVVGSDIAEIVAALDASETVVGRDDTSQYPPKIATLPSVGYLRHLAAEGVLSLQPERLIVSATAGPSEVLGQLESSGVEVIPIDQGAHLDTLIAKIRTVAQAVDQTTKGERLIAEIAPTLEQVASLPPLEETAIEAEPRALFLLSHSGMTPMAAGRDTAADAVMTAVGLDNAFSAFSGYKAVGAEALVAQAPSIVIATRSGVAGLGGEDSVWQLPGLAMTPAGQQKRLIVCDDQALLGFGPRTPATLIALYESLTDARPTGQAEDKGCWRSAS